MYSFKNVKSKLKLIIMHRPYMVGPRITYTEKAAYKTHLKALKYPKTEIQNDAPILPADTYIKQGTLEKDASRIAEIERENRNIVRKLNFIGRTKGRVDHIQGSLLKSTNFGVRTRINKKIETENKEFYKILNNAESKYKKETFIEEYEIVKNKMKEKIEFPEQQAKKKESEEWTIAPEGINKSLLYPEDRIRCFLDFGIKGGKKLGRLIIEVWMDVAPVAGCNFVNLCKGFDDFTYKNTPLHIIVKGIFCVGGDVINKSGTGIYSVYGGINATYADENTTLEFNGPGVVAAHTVFAGDNHSNFLITFKKLTSMNKYFVVFGRVLGSTRIIELIEGYGTKSGTPIRDVVITDCGILGGVKVPNPETITLPTRISPDSSKEILIRDSNERSSSEIKDLQIRAQIIKKSREQMKKRSDWPCYKLNMSSPKNKSFDCTNIFNKTSKRF